MSIIHDSARELIGYHLSVIPAKDKRPSLAWKAFQSHIMTMEEVSKSFNGAPQVAIICGAVSGNLEALDIDLKYDPTGKLFQQWKELVVNADEDLFYSLVIQSTVSGGLHLLYRCPVIEVNQKLARRDTTEQEKQDTYQKTLSTEMSRGKPQAEAEALAQKAAISDKERVLIETRGEGGYIIAAPSQGYRLTYGHTFGGIPTITPEQRALLHSAARSLNQKVIEHQPPPPDRDNAGRWDLSPGDDFDKRGDVVALLESHGWRVVGRQGETVRFLRPGDTKAAHSANWNQIPGRFWCWSTSAAFNAEQLYKPYAVFAVLECEGDFKRAAAKLHEQGYGKKKPGSEEEEIIDLVRKDERGLAELFSHLYEGRARYDHTYKTWRLYKEGTWQLDEKKILFKTLPATLQKEIFRTVNWLTEQINQSVAAGQSDKAKALSDTKKELYKQAAALNKRAVVANVLTFAGSYLSVLTNELDNQPHLINLANGTFDCRKFSFRPHAPADLLSKQSAVAYDQQATCPKWEAFLDTIFQHDKELIAFVQRAVGYTFTGLSDMQALLFCYGSGGNGKTIFFAVMQMMLRDYYSTIPVETLLAKQKNQSDEYHLAGLKGARCVVASEIPQDRRLNESQVKDITGGDHIVARAPYGMPFSYAPTHTLWMFGNHKPVIRGTDHGIWRRMHLIPFTYTIPKDQRRDKNLVLSEFSAEMPGIFNWAMHGLLEYDRMGLNPPAAVREATEEYKQDSNNFQTFIKERCQDHPVGSIASKALYNAYVQWCEQDNETQLFKNAKQMNSFLRENGYTVEEGTGHVNYVKKLVLLQRDEGKTQDNIF